VTDLRCTVEGCGREAFDVSPVTGKLLCRDCWAWVALPHKDGSGFVEWVRSVLARRRSTS
jgi:hypothetical protein